VARNIRREEEEIMENKVELLYSVGNLFKLNHPIALDKYKREEGTILLLVGLPIAGDDNVHFFLLSIESGHPIYGTKQFSMDKKTVDNRIRKHGNVYLEESEFQEMVRWGENATLDITPLRVDSKTPLVKTIVDTLLKISSEEEETKEEE
jgi:hypothetical protein